MSDDDPSTDGAGEPARPDDVAAGGDESTVDGRSADGSTVDEGPNPPTYADERPSAPATVGLVVAVLAIVASTGEWPGTPFISVAGIGSPLVAVLAATALLAFGARRRGVVKPGPVSVVAGVAWGGVIIVSSVRLVAPAVGGHPVTAGTALPTALVLGIVGIGTAVADRHGVDAAGLLVMGRSVASVFGVIVGAFVLAILTSWLLGSLPALAKSKAGELVLNLIVGPLTEIAFVVVAVAFVLGTDRGWSYFDLDRPSLPEAILGVASSFGLLVVQIMVAVIIKQLELPSSSQRTIQRAGETAADLGRPELVLVLIPMMVVVVGPIEELLYRNVVQKRLYDAFSRYSALLIAGLLFAGSHILAYANQNPAAVFVSLTSIFLIGLLLGVLYLYTENVTVPAIAHGLYNSTQVFLLYLSLVFSPQGGGSAAWALSLLPF